MRNTDILVNLFGWYLLNELCGAMAVKRYFAFPKVPSLLKTPHQNV